MQTAFVIKMNKELSKQAPLKRSKMDLLDRINQQQHKSKLEQFVAQSQPLHSPHNSHVLIVSGLMGGALFGSTLGYIGSAIGAIIGSYCGYRAEKKNTY